MAAGVERPPHGQGGRVSRSAAFGAREEMGGRFSRERDDTSRVRDAIVGLLSDLVRIDSVNPSLVDGGAGEGDRGVCCRLGVGPPGGRVVRGSGR